MLLIKTYSKEIYIHMRVDYIPEQNKAFGT